MAGDQDLKLLGSFSSPFVMRARIALNLKGLGYEFLEEVPGTKSELLIKFNPVYKKIPILIHNGKPICESMIIVQYIDEVWAAAGPSILPSDPYDRAIARFWAVDIDDKNTARMAGHQELKLLGSLVSPFVRRPRIALNLKGVAYEFCEEVPGTKSELLLKSNPVYKKIPVLIHNGKPICESMIIVQYIGRGLGSSGTFHPTL